METTTTIKPATTTQYWGYRELTADELKKVGGGDDGGDAGDGDGDADADADADADSDSVDVAECAAPAPTNSTISESQANSLAQSVAAITGGFVSAATAFAGNISTGVVGPSTTGTSTGSEAANPGFGNPMGDPGPNSR